jgi:23S rRNA pseudouridine1911/1915/1917 synthase
MERIKHRINLGESEDVRLDRYLAGVLGLASRSQIKARVVKVLINGREGKLSRRVKQGDELEVFYSEPPCEDTLPEDIELDIIYEDKNVTVVNKPQGMVVHPAKGNFSGTLVNALLFHYREVEANFPDDPLRPGIVHRLDKDTSGVMIVTRNTRAHELISEQFRGRAVRKIYLAVVKGTPPSSSGRIDRGIMRDPRRRKRFTWSTEGGKRAITSYRVLRSFSDYCLLALRPHTGRTHQIRVHTLSMGCPVLGDPIYSRRDKRFPDATLMLHSYRLRLRLPGMESEAREFKAPLPSRFKTILKQLGGEQVR